VKIDWSEPGVPLSVIAHAAVLVASLVALSSAQPLADAQESVPVEIITADQFSAMTKGEQAAQEVQPTPRVDTVAEAEQLKPTQGTDVTDVPTPPTRAPEVSEAASAPPLPPTRPPDPVKPEEKAEPAKVEPAKLEPAKAEAPKAEPPKAEPAKAQPAKAEPAKPEPARAEAPKPAEKAPAAKANDNTPHGVFARGVAQLEENKPQEALKTLEPLEANPEFAVLVQTAIGRCYAQLSQLDEALARYAKALEVSGHPEEQYHEALYYMAAAHESRNDDESRELATWALEEIFAANPKYRDVGARLDSLKAKAGKAAAGGPA